MIPLILKDGRLSFLGIQVKFVKQDGVNTVISKATGKMTFFNMFEERTELRPFGLIILALGDYRFEGKKKLEVSLSRETGISSEAPTILVFKGKPKLLQESTFVTIFDLAPKFFSYRGVCSEHLKACDHLFGLINELPFSDEAIEALENYEPKGYEQAILIESMKSNSSNRSSKISKANKSSVPEIASEDTIPNSVASTSTGRNSRNTPPSKKPDGKRSYAEMNLILNSRKNLQNK
jgi:hypothetical protein